MEDSLIEKNLADKLQYVEQLDKYEFYLLLTFQIKMSMLMSE